MMVGLYQYAIRKMLVQAMCAIEREANEVVEVSSHVWPPSIVTRAAIAEVLSTFAT